MNEGEETEITYVEDEDGENEDNGNKAVTGEAGRVIGSPIVLTEDLPPLVVQVNEISTCSQVHTCRFHYFVYLELLKERAFMYITLFTTLSLTFLKQFHFSFF